MVVHIIDFSTVVVHNNNNNNKLNPLGAPLRRLIWTELHAAQTNPNVTSLVLTGGTHGCFSAGADLTELTNAVSAAGGVWKTKNNKNMGAHDDISTPSLLDLVQAVEASDKPIVACIGAGVCLGGGLELALACHYRVAAATAQLGLPEVRVGLIPGAGGTQRLPRLIGLREALPLILTGNSVAASRALTLKLIDAMVPPVVESTATKDTHNPDSSYQHLLQTAIQWAEWAEVLPLEPRRCRHRAIPESPAVAHAILHVATLRLPQRGSAALCAAWEACRAAVVSGTDFQKGLQRESELFLEALVSPEGLAQRYAFFAVRRAQKILSPPPPLQQHALLQKDVAHVKTAVIGAGTMGAGIAIVLLRAGFAVTLVDVDATALARGVERIRQSLTKNTKKQKSQQAQAMLERLSSTTELRDLHDCQLIVEAVVENMKIKQRIFHTLDEITTRSDCLLLSNTSTLDIDAMAASVVKHHCGVTGWHFFSPAHVMPLVEIVRGRDTDDATVAILQALTKRVGKIGVVVGNCHGFCGNRLLQPYAFEMLAVLVEHGNSVSEIDAALRDDLGMAMGPFAMADLAGNDISYNIRREQGWVRRDEDDGSTSNTRPSRYSELADDLVTQLGRLGQKVGKGWYDYEPNSRTPRPSQEVTEFCQRYRVHPPKPPLSSAEIIERLLYPLVNEGFKCLEENVTRCPSDIDVVYLYGYGWPVWRGGPMYWADHEVGLDVILDKLREFQTEFPDTKHFVPSRLLMECVQANVTVEEYYQQQQQQSSAHSKL